MTRSGSFATLQQVSCTKHKAHCSTRALGQLRRLREERECSQPCLRSLAVCEASIASSPEYEASQPSVSNEEEARRHVVSIAKIFSVVATAVLALGMATSLNRMTLFASVTQVGAFYSGLLYFPTICLTFNHAPEMASFGS